METAASATIGRAAGRSWHQCRRCHGRDLLRACLIDGRVFQSLLVMPLRKPSSNGPQISQVSPAAAIAGGELQIRGKGFAKSERPHVMIGDVAAPIIIGSDSLVIARVPEGASAGELVIESGKQSSE